jgi:hypothetical protein
MFFGNYIVGGNHVLDNEFNHTHARVMIEIVVIGECDSQLYDSLLHLRTDS